MNIKLNAKTLLTVGSVVLGIANMVVSSINSDSKLKDCVAEEVAKQIADKAKES